MSDQFQKKDLTLKSEDIAQWYNDIVQRADLASYSKVKGSMIIKPNGYAIWEMVQKTLDSWFKEGDIRNAYFPLFIPMSLLQKEKDHVAGFSPELAVVTHAGGEELAEPYAVRPTSETIMYDTFSDWIQSYRDLPLKINQWCNVVRWEKRTYPFLRTTEFLWQEGHTVHRTEEEAMEMVMQALGWYKRFYEEYFGISVYAGLKSRGETFAGAKSTYAIELVMPDGRALQAATSHNLGDHFSKVFEILFLDDDGQKKNPYQTSWGISTRSIGGLILTHGDDAGLVVPPMVAPYQVVVVAIGKEEDESVKEYAINVFNKLKSFGLRVKLDDRLYLTLGRRINNWELQGVPLRIEIGAKDIEKSGVMSARRDILGKDGKKPISLDSLETEVHSLLSDIQSNLFKKTDDLKKSLTTELDSYDDFKKLMESERKFVRVPWCESTECEAIVKDETKATPRVCELDQENKEESHKCFHCGEPAKRKWLFAQSY